MRPGEAAALFGAAAGVAFLLGRTPRLQRVAAGVRRGLASRWVPHVAGILTAAAVWFVWGSLAQVTWVSDEASYLLQAKLFASGAWHGVTPRPASFFEQMHVLVAPVLASKYPPGHALALVPGIWLGLPGLVPVLASGIAGALFFWLARRAAGEWAAALGWGLWVAAPANLLPRASYLSETTTSALWLAGFAALWFWLDTRRTRWLVALALCTGWCAITRPLTALAFAMPVGVVVLVRVARERRWAQLAAGLATGVVVLAIIPWWSASTTGSWRTTPLAQYTRAYMPWDRLGFGLDSTPALRPVPTDIDVTIRRFVTMHERYTFDHLGATALVRARRIQSSVWAQWRAWLAPLALVGLIALPAVGWPAVAATGLLFALYLLYAHPPGWTVYYLEGFPVLAFIVGLGLWATLHYIARIARPTDSADARRRRADVMALACLALVVAWSLQDVSATRGAERERLHKQLAFRDAVQRIPDGRAIVFLLPDSTTPFVDDGLVAAEPEMATAKLWILHDQGDRDTLLLRRFPERAAYHYDRITASLLPFATK